MATMPDPLTRLRTLLPEGLEKTDGYAEDTAYLTGGRHKISADAMRDELATIAADALEQLDDLQSFDGIMREIDKHYPLEVPYFRDSNDPGCVAEANALELERERALAKELAWYKGLHAFSLASDRKGPEWVTISPPEPRSGDDMEIQTRSLPTAALRDVVSERARQDARWGEQNHGLLTWCAILGEEFGEFQQAILEGFCFDNDRRDEFDAAAVRGELVQVCAVALAALECIDRNGVTP